MNKKLFFCTVLLLGIFAFSVSANASCSIWRYKSDVKNVKINSSFDSSNAPVIAIGWSRDHTEDLSFFVELSGAEWDYGNSGTIQQGVTYRKVNKNTLEIMADVGTGPDEINFGGGRNILLPIYCTITNSGEIRVIVNGNETTVSNANILIAKSIDGRLTLHGNKAKINKSGVLKKITITDSSTQTYKQNQKITLSLDTGFKFTGETKITGTGKFENIVSFSVDGKNPSKAYITITADTPEENGEIILEDCAVTRSSGSKFSALLMTATFTASIVPLDSTIAVASYDAQAEDITSEQTTETTTAAAAVQTTEAAPVRTTEAAADTTTKLPDTVKIQIGADSYSVNGISYPIDVPAYISNGSTMLPLRAVANALGIEDKNISYDARTKTVRITPQSDTYVSITADTNTIKLYKGGTDGSIKTDTPAQIKDGRLFLPLRATANALGIPDSSIEYDAATKTVTIYN